MIKATQKEIYINMKQLRRVVQPLLAVALLFYTQLALTQRLEPRIKGAISETDRVVLRNSRTPRVVSAQDLGAVSQDTAVPGITLVFRRSPAQEATLKELLGAQQDTRSPLYHQWLTPETFAARFGIASEDIEATEAWLAIRGFHIDSVARSRDRITFSGTAAQVQSAFGTELHHYRTEGELHFAPASDLTLPAELASVTAAVLHLSDFRPKPSIRVQTHAQPDYTTSTTQAHYLGPKDIATMYDLSPLYSKNFDGAGQGLAVVGQSFVNLSSVVSFFSFMVQTTNPTISTVLVPGSGIEAFSPGDEGESEIDLEYSLGIAKGANIFLVYVGANQNYDVFDALAFAITDDIAPVISISYSICEPLLSQSELAQGDALFEEATAQGQTLVAAAGDSGSTACSPYNPSAGFTAAQQQALAVNFPASSPHVTAVGGTQMAAGTFSTGPSSYWGPPALGGDAESSLLSYVPEVPWNEGSASTGIAAGGGGISAYYPRPAWQSGVPGIAPGAYRLLPDIALQSSSANPGYLVCSSDQSLIRPETLSCLNGMRGSGNFYTVVGGTSFAAPIFAGFIAILNEAKFSTGQGDINPELYSLAVDPTTYAAVFHDITSGSNACVSGAANCTPAGQSNFAATVGYDEASGLGSVDFNALTVAWPSSNTKSLLPTDTFLTAATSTVATGAMVRIQISVQPFYTATAPTGSVSISVDGILANPSLPLVSTTVFFFEQASATYDFVAPAVSGSHLIAVRYSGDATHLPSTATYSVLVGNALASGGLSLSSSNLSVATGGTGSSQITVTPNAGYAGRVVWSLSATGASSLTACYSIASLPVSTISTTKLTIGVGTSCNSAFPAERGNLHVIGQRASGNDRNSGRWRSTTATEMYAGLLMCGLLVGGLRRVRLPLLLAIACLTVTGVGLTGCGGSGNSTTPPSTPPSITTTYNITLTGTDSVNTAITASTTFTLTVN